MLLYLIRHGETDWNKNNLVQGRMDNPLNETGIEQAKKTAKFFKEIPDHIISSSLGRAKKTMEIIQEENGWSNLKLHIDDNFIERDFGVLEGKLVEHYKKVDDFSTVVNCETNEVLERRIDTGIKKILEKYNKEEKVLITCHSHVLKAFLCMNYPQEYTYKYSLPNCAIVKVKIVNKKIKNTQIIKGE